MDFQSGCKIQGRGRITMTELRDFGMICARVPRLDALRHKRLPVKFPPKLDAIIRIPIWHVNRAVA
jgi:hypothetical protein